MALLFLSCCTLERETGSIVYLPLEIRCKIFEFIRGHVAFKCQFCPRVLCHANVNSLTSYTNLETLERICLECYASEYFRWKKK